MHWMSNFDSSDMEGFDRWVRGLTFLDETALNKMPFLPEYAHFGMLQPSLKPGGDKCFINTHEPFCGVVVGVQGSGKSHTTNSMIEACVIQNTPEIELKVRITQLMSKKVDHMLATYSL